MEEAYLIKSALADDVADGTYVWLVLAVRTIFVLHLNHDDRTTILDGEWSQLLAHFLLEDFYSLHEVRILLTQTDILLLEEPPRQATHFPFCTNVWTRANDDIHAVLLGEAAESSHIVVACEVEFAFLLLMDIPEHIEADGIHAKSLAHLDAMLPVGTRNTRIV